MGTSRQEIAAPAVGAAATALQIILERFPGLPAWAKLCRAYGTGAGRLSYGEELFDVGFLLEFRGFQALAYFGLFAGSYFYCLSLGYEAFGFEDYCVVAGL
jgi:hypothetical protein